MKFENPKDIFSFKKLKSPPLLAFSSKKRNYFRGLKLLLTFWGWKEFFKILSKKERVVFLISFLFLILSGSFLVFNFYLKNTKIVPAKGGSYIEGIVGQPRFLNPIYASLSDVDRDLVELLFVGLMKYNEKGEIVYDLAKDYEIKEGGKVWEFYLKENLFWSDGHPLTAEDIVFTIKTIQNPDYQSPERAAWIGVKVEKISDLAVKFTLRESYAGFLENTTLKILPKHIWQDFSPENFSFSFYNLNPISSGPYKVKEIKQDQLGYIKSLTLTQNPYYHEKKPYISKITFLFFQDEKELVQKVNQKKIQGFSLLPFSNLEKIKEFENWKLYQFSSPRYFAVFFNPEELEILKKEEIRQAFYYATNRQELIEKLFGSYLQGGEIVNSPILPKFYGFEEPEISFEFNLEKGKELLEKEGFVLNQETGLREKTIIKEPSFQFKSDLKLGSQGQEVRELQKCLAKDAEIYPEGEITGYFGQKTKKAVIRFQEKYAKEILEPWGFKKGTGLVAKTTRAKLNEICFPKIKEVIPLEISLTTLNQFFLKKTAEILKSQWEKLGIKVKIKTFDFNILEQEIIKPRKYQALLFGQVLKSIPDPYPFWHSSQVKDPGLNLALYENKKVDKLLEETRKSLDFQTRKEKLEEFQNILLKEVPAIFLYSLDYLYFLWPEIKGVKTGLIVDPSKRFSLIENWYIKTKRKWQ